MVTNLGLEGLERIFWGLRQKHILTLNPWCTARYQITKVSTKEITRRLLTISDNGSMNYNHGKETVL